MPVFGKGRVRRPKFYGKPELEGVKIELYRESVKAGAASGRRYRRSRGYKYEITPLSGVERFLHFNVTHWVLKRYKKVKRPVNVLDWGCGQGTAITELVKRLPSKVNAYGYSKDFYPSWTENPHVKFIQETHDQVPRFFKKIPLDLILSLAGLHHLQASMSRGVSLAVIENRRRWLKEYKKYILRLAERLAPGGVLVTSFIGLPSHVDEFASSFNPKKDRVRARVLHCSYYPGAPAGVDNIFMLEKI
ncbi:MAG: class I SAM-dependent methyltransferase [Candidatus Diapherotrites archaeon]|nr:class I SAM-dependent methyltransferase [Candidatus Diapherotrites archaeon]